MRKRLLFIFLAMGLTALLLAGCTAKSKDQQNATNAQSPTTTSEANTMEINGIQMPYAKTGNGSKTLVIIPGLSIKQVTPLIDAVGAQYQAFLDADYTIYVMDRRTNAPEGYTIQDMAQDTATCLAQLGITRADVAGVSQGGAIALYLAAENPQLVDHLMLGSTSAFADQSMLNAVNEWIDLAEPKQEDALIASFGQLVYSPETWEANQRVIRIANRNITDQEFDRFAQMAKALLGYDCRNSLSTITAKCLVLGSKGDKVFEPENMEQLAALLHCEIYLYEPTFGHAVYDEAPDYVNRLLAFCQQG